LTHQEEFGGAWTQQKLEALGKYLRAYTTIFKRNQRAKFYSISYVDAFAGTGTLRRPELGQLAEFVPGLLEAEEEFRKGSVKRALEIDPPFDEYVFIEKSARKCDELRAVASKMASRNVRIINEDANGAILKWCRKLNARRQRAVVFLDPFGASVKWEAIAAIGKTRAVDLWVLFPFSAVNRMLVRDQKPPRHGRNVLQTCSAPPTGRRRSIRSAHFHRSSIRQKQLRLFINPSTIVRSRIFTQKG
jgi:three-Cys-motif partner protein